MENDDSPAKRNRPSTAWSTEMEESTNIAGLPAAGLSFMSPAVSPAVGEVGAFDTFSSNAVLQQLEASLAVSVHDDALPSSGLPVLQLHQPEGMARLAEAMASDAADYSFSSASWEQDAPPPMRPVCQKDDCWARTVYPKRPHRHVHIPLDELLDLHRYECPVCGMIFPRDQNLQKHFASHKEEAQGVELPPPRNNSKWKEEILGAANVYECPCARLPSCKQGRRRGRGFKQLQTLYEHVKSAHRQKSFDCQFVDCEQSFSSSQSLKKHISAAHPESRTKCPYCDKDYQRKQGMQRHVRKEHKGKTVPR